MSNYKITELEPQTLEEPAAMAYGMELSAREHVMASTVSVDEYFDELIEQVHHDYANL
ncbi:MAG: hypothetical protein K6F78_04780 [Bacteroidaceae bacterium]|nr:hypothetical protein [Bacteroidaceae bacterium]